jgi:putative oxidoreductase
MKNLVIKLIDTDNDLSGLVIRVSLGLVMFPHGAQKLLGWYGGFGFSNTMGYFTSNGTPWLIAFLVIMAESLGIWALILGFFSRFMAFSIGLVMLGAIFMVHLKFGFFMNWMGKQPGEGYEYHILAIGLALATMLKGSGKLSIDRLLLSKLRKQD